MYLIFILFFLKIHPDADTQGSVTCFRLIYKLKLAKTMNFLSGSKESLQLVKIVGVLLCASEEMLQILARVDAPAVGARQAGRQLLLLGLLYLVPREDVFYLLVELLVVVSFSAIFSWQTL